MTVGDLCFEILGAITNRRYAVFAYQPTSSAYVRSPVLDDRLATYLRHAWGGADFERRLADSLVADAKQRVDWDLAAGGVIRLVRYFPTEAADAVNRFLADSRPLAETDVEVHRRLSAVMRTLATSNASQFSRVAADIATRESDAGLFLAAVGPLYMASDRERHLNRIEAVLRVSVRDYNQTDAERVLYLTMQAIPDARDQLLDAFLEGPTRGSQLLRMTHAAKDPIDWIPCALIKLLKDTSLYESGAEANEPTVQVRNVAAARLLHLLGLPPRAPEELTRLVNDREEVSLLLQRAQSLCPRGTPRPPAPSAP